MKKTPKVYILATCRKPELLPATLLVFDTIRVGFPTASIDVHINGICCDPLRALEYKVMKVNGALYKMAQTIHHEWIESLIYRENEPFFICDTDVIFWDNFEKWDFSGHALAGRYIPQFYDEFSKCITRPRLHTSLLYIDPVEVRKQIKAYYNQFPDTPFNPKPNLFYPMFHPLMEPVASENADDRLFPFGGRLFTNYFYDTCSMLYHAIGGLPFNEEHLNCFDHLHCGTISDIIAPHLSIGKDLVAKHQAAFANPQLAKGCWKHQNEYFKHFKA